MATMKAWQITSAAGGFENNLFRPASGAPKPVIQDTQILVEVHTSAINPADYKVPELGLISKVILPSPSTPCMDFCGKVVETGSKTKGFKNGEMVFGTYIGEFGHGSLAQYIAVRENMITGLPEGVDVDQAAAIGAAGLTAYQTIAPNVKSGDKVFVNGGSGGTGTYGIQVAKALGCHVTTCCSTANVELCKELGADDVIDYKEVDVVEALEKKGRVFKLVVDNIGNLAAAFRRLSASCVLPEGKFIQVSHQSLGGAGHAIGNKLIPGFLGGGKCAYEFYMTKAKAEDLAPLAAWLKEGKIRSVLDSVFEFEDAPKAFEKLKTGRTKGKIVIHVKA